MNLHDFVGFKNVTQSFDESRIMKIQDVEDIRDLTSSYLWHNTNTEQLQVTFIMATLIHEILLHYR